MLKISNNKEQLSALLLVAFYLGMAFTWAVKSDYAWDDDAPTRIYNCVDAFNNPAHFVSLWSRPLFVLLFAIPSLISIHAVHWIMPILSVSGAYALFLGFQRRGFKGALLLLPFLLFQSYLFILSYQAYTEPLAVVLISWSIFAYLEKKWVLLAVLAGLLPLARLELAPLLLFPFILMMHEKQWKSLGYIILPSLLWHFAGAIIYEDPLYLLNQTVLKESDSNRYGHNEWYVYLHRYLFVIGPVIFIPFLSGLFVAFVRRKYRVFAIIFTLGFFIYTLFSWKLDLGNAAGFLRNITILGPFVALFSSLGVMEIWDFMNGKRRIPLPIFQRKKVITSEDDEKDDDTKALKQWQGIVVIGLALVSGILACTHFAHKVSKHHKIEEEVDILIPFFGLSALFILLGVAFVLRKSKHQIPYTYLIAFSALSLAFITTSEPPNTSYSEEREKMAEVAQFHQGSKETQSMTYANHVWFYWSQELNKHDTTRFQTITQKALQEAEEGASIVWDNHYSSRLAGDVDAGFFNRESKDFLELYRAYSSDRELLCVMYKKLPLRKQMEYMESFYERYSTESSVKFAYAKFLAEKAQKPAESIPLAKEVIQNDTTLVDALGTVGMSYFNLKQWDSSLVYLQALEQKVKDNDQLFYSIGSAYFNSKRYPESVIYMNKTVAKNPRYPNARYVKAAALVNQNDFEAALVALDKEVQVNPNNAAAWLLSGKLFYNQQKSDLACQHWKKAAQLGNTEAAALLVQVCQ